MKKTFSVALFLLLAGAVTPLHAQSGCLDSPENPTILLALVGSAGAAVAAVRGHFRK